MISSMTAFARAEKTREKLTIIIEIRSYNSRYLDIALRIPHEYLSLEDKIKGFISDRVSRGRLEIEVKIKDDSNQTSSFEIDESRSVAYHKALVQLKERFNINTEISLDLLAGMNGIIKPAEIEKDTEICWEIIKDCLADAANGLIAMRKREGEFIADDIIKRLDYIEKKVDQISEQAVDLVSYYQERLKERISVLTEGIIEIDPERIVQEAAFLADRSDISEEIVRVKSHIEQFRAIMDSEEPAGRKLNFLLQEINREFNTMGSKTGKANISHIIVDVKSELEKIREQVQNVE